MWHPAGGQRGRRPSVDGSRRLLTQIHDAVIDGRVSEGFIEHPTLHVYGDYDPATDHITINLPLLRACVIVHEALHRLYPRWSETTVRRRTTQLMLRLTDDDVRTLDARVVAATAATTRKRRARVRGTARSSRRG